MPWTRKQVKKLLSSGSPLTGPQQDRMKSELHSDPSMGHKKKGSIALKRTRARKPSDSNAYVNGKKV